MRDWPTDPIRQHNLVIAALCEDGLRLDGPNVARVTEINRQLQSTREAGCANNEPASNHG